MTSAPARVAGRSIPLALVEQRVAAMRTGPHGRQMPPVGGPGYRDLCRWILRELVTEAIVAHEMAARGIADVNRFVVELTGNVAVDERDVRAYYERNPDLYRRAGSITPFEEARSGIERELLVDARERAFRAWLGERHRQLVSIDPDWEHPGHPVYGLASHRH